MAKSKSGSKTMVLLTLAVLVVLFSLFLVTRMSGKVDQTEALKNQPSLENQPTMGNPSAGINIVEFGDYKCPSCKAWGEQVFPQLKKEYMDTGKAKFSYINVLFHGEESKLGALAAESVFAQDNDAYWKFHKQLFDTQPRENHDAPWITVDVLLNIAKAYAPQVDAKKVGDDIKNQITMPQVNIDEQLVKTYNIQQTPSLMINGVMVKNPFDYNEITSIINKR
ncbi:thioredoxin domain-containing protein [Paenibacillus agricola]|uniref:DsbA family protein n=1 Tax=Paenibacillus agricola TaxID=2716264 RepID=A0ABX0IZG6_9BACL|nr:thioredoxin domain-containing protein [Paenibacillus agricola]NHN28219.1 DsbA family protein [Paenibacillus agricola]